MKNNKSQNTYIVTGATGGIGEAIVKELVSRKVPCIVLACRNLNKANELIKNNKSADTVLVPMRLDLEAFSSVRQFADEIEALNYSVKALINNAGTMPGKVRITADGYESSTQTNFLSTVLLTELLLPTLCEDASIVFTTSMTRQIATFHDNWDYLSKKHHNRFVTYGRSKKMLTSYALTLSNKLSDKNIRVNCSDPWIVDSGIICMGNKVIDSLSNCLFRPLIYTPRQGASSAISAMESKLTGRIFTLHSSKPIPQKYIHDSQRQIIENAISKIMEV